MKKRILFLSVLPLAVYALCQAQSASGPLLRHVPANAPQGGTGAVIVDAAPLAHTALVLPLNEAGELIGKDDPGQQITCVFERLLRALENAGAKNKDIIKLNISVASQELVPLVKEQVVRRFAKGKGPAMSFVVNKLPHTGALLGIDAVAVSAHRGDKVLRSPQAAVLPQGGAVYISGMAAEGPIPEAAANTLQQLHATLQFLGLDKEQVVQIRAFVHPADSSGLVEREIKKFFSGSAMPPVVYAGWNSSHPLVEIELIAASPAKNATPVEYITPAGATSSPVYSKVCRINHGKRIYLSGLYGQGSDGQAQLRSVFESLKEMMAKCNSDLRHLVKALYYVSGTEASAGLTDIRKKYYQPECPPAASKAMLSQPGPGGSQIMIDMIGVQP